MRIARLLTHTPRFIEQTGTPRSLAAAALVCGLAFLTVGCAPEPDDAPAAPAQTAAPTAPAPPESSVPDDHADSSATPDTGAAQPQAFDVTQHSPDNPASIWVVSNKQRPLNPITFTPTDLVSPENVVSINGQPLRAAAAEALDTFVGAAAAAGHTVHLLSGYRSYEYQSELYTGYVSRDGQLAADTYSARPGHSEHQTGLAADLDDGSGCALEACFGDTPAGVWLAAHAADHGFVIRYPEGKQEVTGFMPEPWHFRFVGTDLAQEMQRTGVTTLEEFFGLPAAADYST